MTVGAMSPRYRIVVTGAAVLRATVGTTLATLFGGALAFGMAVIAARALGPSAKGSYDLLVASGTLGALVLGFSLPTGVTYVVSRSNALAPRIPWVSLATAGAAAAGVALLVGIFSEPLAAVGILPAGAWADVAAPVAILAGATLYLALTRATLVAVNKINRANFDESIGRLVAFTGSLGLAAAGIATSSGLAYALAAGLALGAVLQTITLAPRGLVDRKSALAIGAYSVPSYASSLMQFLNYRLDLFLVAAIQGLTAVGLYATAVLVGQLVWLLARGAALAIFPMVAGDASDPRIRDRVAQASRFAVLTGIAGALAIGAVGAALDPVVFGPEFKGAVQQHSSCCFRGSPRSARSRSAGPTSLALAGRARM